MDRREDGEVKRLVATTLLVSLVLVGSALADTKTMQDPQGDTEGVGGNQAKDIRSVTASHTASGKLKWTIVFWNRNASNDYRPLVRISLDANDPNANCDRNYEGQYDIGGTPGEVSHTCQGETAGTYITSRPNGKTFVYKVAPSVLGSPSKLFWGVTSNADQAPNDSRFYMYGPGMPGIKHRL